MPEPLIIVCPNCDAVNRAPQLAASRRRHAACGKCKAKLFTGHPIALDDTASFLKHIEKSDIPVLVDFWARLVRSMPDDGAGIREGGGAA